MFDHRGVTIRFLVLLLVCMEIEFRFASAGEIRCIEREREVLLTLKKGLTSDYNVFLSSWGNEDAKKECCKWEGVVCSNTTGNVLALVLAELYLGGQVSSSLTELHHLKRLDLSQNLFQGYRIPEFIGSMKSLRHLNLKESGFSGIVPPRLGNLTNLETLDLSENLLFSENFNWLSLLSLLSKLDLRINLYLSDTDWLQPLLELPSLQELYLSNCGITDVELSARRLVNSSSTSLSILDLFNNELTSSTIDWLFNISTNLVGPNLKELHLGYNKLKRLPPNLGRFSKLEVLDVSFNSLEGTISEANFMKLHNLKWLDLSLNSLTLNISPDWSPPFQLDIINLASCNIGPRFPTWIQTHSNFYFLDLSSAGVSDQVPEWLWSLSPSMQYLNLSHNQISGTITSFLSNSIAALDVTSNNFSGPIPLLQPITKAFHLSQNMFSGSISSKCTFHQLYDLRLVGELPNCWENMTFLQVLDLANNNFSGEIPHALGSLTELETLQLRNNNLSGKLPSSLKNCKDLKFIDIGGNKLTGNIPAWIGANYIGMTYLSFRHNRFYGNIPVEICSLTQIRDFDLSGNNISGRTPECFDKFTLSVEKNNTSPIFLVNFQSFVLYINYALVQWKGHELKYSKTLGLLKLIDLSSNRLVGNIPKAFSSLRGLISLNLSRNNLTGNMDPNIGQMEKLESLDLSRNHLSGEIPVGLAQLHYLAVLDLANNNLSGEIPSSTQLQSLNASVYVGNGELCGLPLKLYPSINNQVELEDIDEKDDGFTSLSFVQEFCISMILGFIVGFWGIVGSLLLKKSWRNAYFNFLDDTGAWLYATRNKYSTKF